MKFLLPAATLAMLALFGCSKAPEPTSVADDYAQAEIQKLEQRLNEFERRGNVPTQAGLETTDLGRRLAQFEQRIHALETGSGGAAPSAGASSTDTASPGSPTSSNPLAGVVPSGTTNYTEEQVADFRRLYDVVEKRKQDEVQAERIESMLTRAQVDLTSDQKKAVVALTLAWQAKQRDLFRGGGGFGSTDEERQAMKDKVDALKAQYVTDLRNILPTAAAEKIADSMGRGSPGFYGGGARRVDGTSTRGGMSGN